MTAANHAVKRFVYIHGFKSSPTSEKARIFRDCLTGLGTGGRVPELVIPALPFDPVAALSMLEEAVAGVPDCFLIGSSLGGYYATWLAEKYGCRAALINPAVAPAKTLGAEFLGRHVNPSTGEEYEITMKDAEYLNSLDVEVLQYPANYLLLVQTGDEVLDYRLAVEKYAGAKQIVQPGGSHDFENFAEVVPDIFRFAGIAT